MNILAWLLALAMLVILMTQAVAFHQATVCRQGAWLKGVELSTMTLLDQPKERDQAIIPSCRVYVTRKGQNVSWRRLPSLKSHQFKLPLKGAM